MLPTLCFLHASYLLSFSTAYVVTLILAARCKEFPELDFLLNFQDIDGDICNWQQQNPLLSLPPHIY